jgi:hypothetical protein
VRRDVVLGNLMKPISLNATSALRIELGERMPLYRVIPA